MARQPDYVFRSLSLSRWLDVAALVAWFQEQRRAWYFRGHADGDWPLSTTLERAMTLWRRKLSYMPPVERRIILSFRRRAHLHGYAVSPQSEAEATAPLEWLAMIQHFGGPTRLLDFTRSFWGAAFFALEPGPADWWPGTPVVWAVDSRFLWKEAMSRLPDEPEYVARQASRRRRGARIECARRIGITKTWRNRRLPSLKVPLALPVEPERVNVRTAAQQGCFIFPLLARLPFADNLFGTFGMDVPESSTHGDVWEEGDPVLESGQKAAVLRVTLPARGLKARRKGLSLLYDMSISADTLFPDLHGLARASHYHVN